MPQQTAESTDSNLITIEGVDEPTVPDPVPVGCSLCGKQDWQYIAKYTTEIATGERKQCGEEIRCGSCGKKANQNIELAIRATEQFKEIRKQEESHL